MTGLETQRTVELPVELDAGLLAALESRDLSEAVQLLGSIIIAGEEAPVFADCPGRAALDLGAVPLDEIDSILDILGDRLLGDDVLSCEEGLFDVRGLVRNGETGIFCQMICPGENRVVCRLPLLCNGEER